MLGDATGVEAARVHDVGDALGPLYVIQAVVSMTHSADGEDDDGGLFGDAAVGVGAVIVSGRTDPVEMGEAQGVDEGLIMCAVGEATDEGEASALKERPCFLEWRQ